MFGIDIIDASLLPAMFVALAAGVISFLSPCVLPVVPPYLAYMSGVSVSDVSTESAARRKVVFFGAVLCTRLVDGVSFSRVYGLGDWRGFP